jgi:DNA-binding MarR family transcriptional regulator
MRRRRLGVARSPEAITRDLLLDTWYDVRAATSRIDELLADAISRAVGLEMTTAEVLMRLLRAPTRSMPTTELARDVSFSSGGFTKVVDRLEAQALVERRADASDRRVTHVALTRSGEARAKQAAATMALTLRRHVGRRLGSAGLRTLRDTVGPLLSP